MQFSYEEKNFVSVFAQTMRETITFETDALAFFYLLLVKALLRVMMQPGE